MSRLMSKRFDALVAYVPGEQPQNNQYIKLNTNESPFPPSPIAQRLARQAAGTVQLYGDPNTKALAEVTAEKLGVSVDNLLFSNGSDEVLDFAFEAYCDAETPALFADITYGFYSVYAARHCVPYCEIPLKDDFGIDVDDYISKKGTVFLANPNAPTAIALSAGEIERLIASDPDRMVVVDEAYVDFGGESVVPLIAKYDNLLVTRTFSKSRSMAGARLGMGIACKEIIADLKKIKYSFNPYNVNAMTAAAGLGAMLDEQYFLSNVAAIIATREKTTAALEAMGFSTTPSSTNFIFAKHPVISGANLYAKLKENGILVRYFDKDRLREYVRITVGSAEEMQVLVDTIGNILGGKL